MMAKGSWEAHLADGSLSLAGTQKSLDVSLSLAGTQKSLDGSLSLAGTQRSLGMVAELGGNVCAVADVLTGYTYVVCLECQV